VRIDKLTLREYAVPFRRPLVTASTVYRQRKGFFICLNSGHSRGWGEAAPLMGISPDSLEDARLALERFSAAIRETPGELEIPDLVNLIGECTMDSPAARFGLETALFDLAARERGLSLAHYFNADSLSKIRVNALYRPGVSLPPGVRCLKVKIGHGSLEEDLEKIEVLSTSLNTGIALRLDVNGKWDLQTALTACRRLTRFRIDYLEQPLPAAALEELARLRRESPIPIAVDESVTSVESAQEVIEAGAADVFVLKPTILGSFSTTAEVVRLARENNIRAVITSALERVVGRLALVHLAAAERITEPCGLLTGDLLDEAVSGPVPGEDGQLTVPVSAGLNYEGDLC